MQNSFAGIYQGKRVLVTGHTGFKGSWLALWLRELGATVYGYSLEAPTEPSHWALLNLGIRHEIGDIRDGAHLNHFIQEIQPEIVFHLAAQPIVRESYRTPIETYDTNVIGSLRVYDACRTCESVRAVVSITTDKVYENREWPWGYRENDPLGGHDPYSASKACADIATTSWIRSFWPVNEFGKSHHVLMASARAGNVIGGGDWASDRLVPDLMRGAAQGKEATIRNPASTRPWEHVLEPLSGYLLLGQRLLQGDTSCAKAWNFGPAANGVLTVGEVLAVMSSAWPKLRYRIDPPATAPHEAGLLTLDCSLARSELQWKPVWDGTPCFQHTVKWYEAYLTHNSVISLPQLQAYVAEARSMNLVWTQRKRP
jgi:CDP-glucose 4,6-dehydratase